MNIYTIYSKDNCPYCTKAKALLDKQEVDYQEIKIGVDITREEFMETYPDVRTVPLIVTQSFGKIGGYQQLVEHFNVKDAWKLI